MKKITAAVVGLGRIASLLEEDALREKPCTHAGAITANKDCVLIAGADIDEERRRLFAEKWQVPVFEDAAEMLAVHKPQILAIATHPDSHWRYCRLAAEHKVPVVICEKPLADNISEARKIARLAETKSPIVITNHERRYSGDYIRAKKILEEGNLGNILSIRAALYMGKTTRLVDQLWHDGTHLADAIMFLTDAKLKHRRCWGSKLNSRSGTAWLEGCLLQEEKKFTTRSINAPEPVRASFDKNLHSVGQEKVSLTKKALGRNFTEFHRVPSKDKRSTPVPVIIEVGAGRDHLVFKIEFSCERGRLRIGNGVFEVWESVPSPYAEKFRSLKNKGETFSGPTGYFANMLKDAVNCVKDPSHTPRSGAIDGLRVIEYLNSVKVWR